MAHKQYSEHHDGKYRVREIGEYIEAHQGRCFGKPTFKGTRVLVHLVLEAIAEPGNTIERVAAEYRIPIEAVQEALRVSADVFHHKLRLPDPYADEARPTKKYDRPVEKKGIVTDKPDE